MKKEKEKPADVVGQDTIEFDRKMRIRLLKPNGAVISDRLIMQNAEFLKGPSVKHPDPLQIEFTLADKGDAVAAQEYLGKLMLDLPINPVKEKKAYKKAVGLLDEEPIKELYHEIVAKSKTQDEMINLLRERGFVFRNTDYFKLFGIPVEVEEKHQGLQFMVRAIKIAKNPKADKYDPQLVFGFKLGKEKGKNVQVYLYKKHYMTLKDLPWNEAAKTINFSKKEMLQFPVYMKEDERLRFSVEHRKLKMDKDATPSKFYNRWKDDIKTR